MIRHRGRFARLALLAPAALLVAACSVTDQTMGVLGAPAGGALFTSYVAIGTSIGAGIQSGGFNDSTQRQAYTYQLAVAMGLTPGADWKYPALNMPGCPAPFTNPLTNTRVGGTSGSFCAFRKSSSAWPVMNNVSIPSIRAAQVINLTNLDFPATDSLKAAQFLTGSVNPLTMALEAHPTFVTLEMGANDVLGAATHNDSTLLTPVASYQASMNQIADSLDAIGAKVAIMNVPNVTVIPHFSAGQMFFCLKTGLCPGVAATLPYSLASFTVDASCAPGSSGGVGDSMLVAFTGTATITQVLAGGGLASLNCGAGTASVTTGAGTQQLGPAYVLNKFTVRAIATRVVTFNTILSTLATARGYALVDANALLASKVASFDIPPFPNFANPAHLFGPLNPAHPDLVSYDGIHPAVAGHTLLADAFVAAINTKFATTLVAP